MKRNIFQRLWVKFIDTMAKIKWSQHRHLTEEQLDELRQLFALDYYVIGTRRSNYLTTWMIDLGHFFLTFRWGKYNHVLMNLENEVSSDDDFRFVEAAMVGTKYSTFEEITRSVDRIVLTRPKNIPIEVWTKALDDVHQYVGTPYDSLFDFKSKHEINCVELVWLAIQKIDNYPEYFPDLTKKLARHKTLTPQMLIDTSDFEVAYRAKGTWK